MSVVVYRINSKKNRRNIFLISILILFLVQANSILQSEKVAAVTGCNPNSGSVTSVTLGDNRTTILTFTSGANADGACTFTVPDNVFAIDYLVVAGGGGGASGGGGGGGFVTSWRTASNSSGTSVDERQTPLSVTPGNDISVTIGRGGQGGAAGNLRASDTNPSYQTLPGSGRDSVFGSITAVGGGAGGHNQSYVNSAFAGDSLRNGTGQSGGSGGGASFDQSNTALVSSSSQSTVVGATSRGNSGGSSTGSGGYRAGAGGGGAGAVGGTIRTCNNGNLANSSGCGGHGGNGLFSDIANGSNTYVAYSCGGGGGINANTNTEISGGGGNAGCSSAGRGSSYGNLNTNYSVTTTSTNANATAGADSFGGGGGGTDPEDTRGGAGGSGVVIIRYTLPDPACPNSNNTSSATTPIACRASVSIAADGNSVSTFVNGNPISYVNTANTPTVSIVTTPTGLTASVSGGQIQVSAPSGSSLAGGTYPLIYRITEGANTSDAVLMVNVTDPGQRTPVVVLVDPRATQVDLPAILVGDISATLVCVTPRTASGAYSNNPTVSSTQSVSGITTTTFTSGGIRFTGNNSDMTTQVGSIRVTAFGAERLLAEDRSRFLDVNVSNTATGGNNSCSGGTESSIELRPLGIDMTIIKGTVGLKN
jgi:hypothetical protein